MTAAPVPRVDISSLPRGAELGSGGQGRVMTVGGFLINGQWAAALKIYSQDVLREMNPAALEEIVRLPRQLSPDDSRWLYENTAWPAVIVEDGGAVCGFLMRAVPPEYYFDFQTRTQGTQQKHADVAFLLNPDDYVSSSGIAVSERDRLALLGALAATLTRLHALGICVGDLSPKNLLFSLAPPPGCFILDCDAMQVRGETVLKQIQTPDWEVPDGEATATAAADSYKFGLLAIRLFARDQSSRDTAPLAALSPELGRLAELSQHPDPLQRPVPGAWTAALQATASAASAAPAAPTRIAIPIAVIPSDPVPAAQPASAPAAPAPAAAAQPAGSAPATRPRARRLFLIGGIGGIAAVIVLVAFLTHAFTGTSPQADPGPATPLAGTSAATTTPPAGATENGQATQINNLLTSSADSRNALSTAVNDVDSCTDLSGAATEIQSVAGQRGTELSEARALSTDALPSGSALQSDLVNALMYSQLADGDFLRWAQGLLNTGCSSPAPETSADKAGSNESKLANTAKQDFLQLWNPIAAEQGLPTRSQNFI